MLSDRLAEAFEAAAQEPRRAIDLRRVVILAKRRRRRSRALLGVSVVLVVAALAVAVTGLVGGSDRSTLTPAVNPPPVLETFAGVDVTVLPEGVHAVGSPDVAGPLVGNLYGLRQTFAGVREPDHYLPPTLTITVEKGRINLDSFARSQQPQASWMTISGQRALLVTFESANGIPLPHPSVVPTAPITLSPSAKASIARTTQPHYALYWSPSPTRNMTLLVEGQAGITLNETLAVARGLVLDPKAAQAPADVPASDSQIRQAFGAAFTGGTPLADTEAAIQDGQGLTSTLNQLKAQHPETADHTKVTVKGISYYDAEHALAAVTLTYEFGSSSPRDGNFWIGAVLLDGQWKVSRANYCDTISLTFVNCPKS